MTRAWLPLGLVTLLLLSCTKPKLQFLVDTTEPCSEDLAKFCEGVLPGEGRLIRCLDPHLNELQPACRAMQDKRRVAIGLVPDPNAPTGTCAAGSDCAKAANAKETEKKSESPKPDSVKMATTERGEKPKPTPKAPKKTK